MRNIPTPPKSDLPLVLGPEVYDLITTSVIAAERLHSFLVGSGLSTLETAPLEKTLTLLKEGLENNTIETKSNIFSH